ncbi:MAG TPA: chromate resistance protein ChrB domain-containing protein [Candidatus Didemnitutus sp.]|nr:chromate resistance protein ChrB domain-containing protein [Candidatus Didemnitutus sp.]
MKWITREKVKVDRVACPWLIKKFVDPGAEFLFAPTAEVPGQARKFGAIPFDIEGCELGHHGEDVSFDSVLKRYRLNDPALALLAEIVRAADSHPGQPHPAGEGLRWIAFGFSALGLSDQEILQREFVVYDALYAECQRRMTAPTAAAPAA